MKRSDAGFTLIEMLCVLVMVGLLSSIVVMNIPSPKSPTQIQAEHLTRDLNALAQDGLISGEVRGVGLTETQFAYYRYDGETFISLKAQSWIDEIRPQFARNGQTVNLPEDLSPLIIFEPTSVNTPFELNLSGQKADYALRSKGDGRVVLVKLK